MYNMTTFNYSWNLEVGVGNGEWGGSLLIIAVREQIAGSFCVT